MQYNTAYRNQDARPRSMNHPKMFDFLRLNSFFHFALIENVIACNIFNIDLGNNHAIIIFNCIIDVTTP